MSWEEINTYRSKCPCGSSTYTVRSFMGDWNRSEERWEMDCVKCKRQYCLYQYSVLDSGMTCKVFRWVRREELKKVEKIEAQLTKAKEEIVKNAKALYVDMWLSYFQDAKSKKEIWRRLTDDGKRYPSLSAFYNHTKDTDLQSYLREEFKYKSISVILQKLHVADREISRKLRLAEQIDSELYKAKDRLIKEGYKG